MKTKKAVEEAEDPNSNIDPLLPGLGQANGFLPPGKEKTKAKEEKQKKPRSHKPKRVVGDGESDDEESADVTFACDLCDRVCPTNAGLEAHIRGIHMKQYRSNLCGNGEIIHGEKAI